MYKINCILNKNSTPWEISLEDRCSLLRDAIAKNKKITLLLYEAPDTSTFRYRGYNMLQATKESEKWQSVYFFAYESETIIKILPLVQLLVIIRVKWTHTIDQIIYRAKAQNIKVLFDVDDLIFDINYLNMVTSTLNVHFGNERDYEFWFAYIGRIGFTASKVDGFITTNDYLGEKLKEKYNKPYRIIINSINQEQVEASEKCLNIKNKLKNKNPYTIGYFSGTPSHINDFKTIYPEIMELLKEFPKMQLSVVGFMEFPNEMNTFISEGRIIFTPLVDFIELQRLIAQVDINIVPLVNNTFTNCKSELKFFEAAIVNTITLATPTFTYKNCITDGVNGFLCKPGQWYEKIKNIYLGKVDCDIISRNAHEYSIDKYFGLRFVRMIEDCYEGFYEE